MISNNNNEAITHLAIPERQIPVLIDSSAEKAEGYVPSRAWSDTPVTRVRRLLPSFVQGLASPQRRRKIEKEHGTISATEWTRLRELLSLIDRWNASDSSPLITIDTIEGLDDLIAQLNRVSPGGWLKETDKSGTGKLMFRSVSGSKSIEIEIGKPTFTPLIDAPPGRKVAPRAHPFLEDGQTAKWRVEGSGECKTVPFAISELFTAGLSKTRFVVWWSDVGKKLVPGPLLPGHFNGIVRVGDVEQRHCGRMGDLSEVQQRLSAQSGQTTLLLPQMPSRGGHETLSEKPRNGSKIEIHDQG